MDLIVAALEADGRCGLLNPHWPNNVGDANRVSLTDWAVCLKQALEATSACVWFLLPAAPNGHGDTLWANDARGILRELAPMTIRHIVFQHVTFLNANGAPEAGPFARPVAALLLKGGSRWACGRPPPDVNLSTATPLVALLGQMGLEGETPAPGDAQGGGASSSGSMDAPCWCIAHRPGGCKGGMGTCWWGSTTTSNTRN